MSDHCSLTIFIAAEHRDRVADRMGISEVDISEGETLGSAGPYVQMDDPEANYGHNDFLQGLAGESIPFFGWHGGGAEYDACQFVSLNGELVDVLVPEHDHRPHVPVEADGSIDTDRLREALKYWGMLREVKTLFGMVLEEVPIPIKAAA